jgi:hypothetical protein
MSESHEDYMEELRKYEVEDALMYKEFEYDRNEWDNIPTIVPRFVLFMSKHLDAIVGKCNGRFNQISTPDLQLLMEQKIKTLENKIDGMNKESSDARNKLLEKISNIETISEKIEKENDLKKV